MSDQKLPYEEAITEGAKAANNAVDLVRESGRAVGPALGNVYGLLLGDRLEAWRERNKDKLGRATKRIFRERGIEDPLAPPESIAIPLFEAAQGDPREEMIDLWARLLANAMDPARSGDVRPEFVTTVQKLEPIDAAVLDIVSDFVANSKAPTLPEITQKAARRDSAISLSLDHLSDLKCVRANSGNHYGMTDFGKELMFALRP